jgi:hypothetical protein
LGITTEIHNAGHNAVDDDPGVPLGTVVHDTANITGNVPGIAIPDVSFTLNGSPVTTATNQDGGNAATRSVDSDPLAAGSCRVCRDACAAC